MERARNFETLISSPCIYLQTNLNSSSGKDLNKLSYGMSIMHFVNFCLLAILYSICQLVL